MGPENQQMNAGNLLGDNGEWELVGNGNLGSCVYRMRCQC